MPLQNSACSKDALADSTSSSMPKESSPPLVAAAMSGRSGCPAPEVMIQSSTARRKKFSNRRPVPRHPYSDIRGVKASKGADTGPARRRGHRERTLGGRPPLEEHLGRSDSIQAWPSGASQARTAQAPPGGTEGG